MICSFIPMLYDPQGRPIAQSLFSFEGSDNLEELKPLAVEKAIRENDRQYICQWGKTYVLFHTYWKSSPYFKGKPIVARFTVTGKEITRKTQEG